MYFLPRRRQRSYCGTINFSSSLTELPGHFVASQISFNFLLNINVVTIAYLELYLGKIKRKIAQFFAVASKLSEQSKTKQVKPRFTTTSRVITSIK